MSIVFITAEINRSRLTCLHVRRDLLSNQHWCQRSHKFSRKSTELEYWTGTLPKAFKDCTCRFSASISRTWLGRISETVHFSCNHADCTCTWQLWWTDTTLRFLNYCVDSPWTLAENNGSLFTQCSYLMSKYRWGWITDTFLFLCPCSRGFQDHENFILGGHLPGYVLLIDRSLKMHKVVRIDMVDCLAVSYPGGQPVGVVLPRCRPCLKSQSGTGVLGILGSISTTFLALKRVGRPALAVVRGVSSI